MDYMPGKYKYAVKLTCSDTRIPDGIYRGIVDIGAPASHRDLINIVIQAERRRNDKDPVLFTPGARSIAKFTLA